MLPCKIGDRLLPETKIVHRGLNVADKHEQGLCSKLFVYFLQAVIYIVLTECHNVHAEINR